MLRDGVGVKLVWKRRPWHRRPICCPPIKKEKAGGPTWEGRKRALGKMSLDWLAERPGREEDLERGTADEDEEEERAKDLYVKSKKEHDKYFPPKF